METVFCIDLDDKNIEVMEFDYNEYSLDLIENDLNDVMELSDYDRVIFKRESQAESFRDEFLEHRKKLESYKIRKTKFPCMLFKRHYIVLALMNYKNQTYRNYKKNWNIGDKFAMNDQTYFVDVELTNLYFDSKTQLYCYEYKIA